MKNIINGVKNTVARKIADLVSRKHTGGKEVIIELLFVAIGVGLIIIFRTQINQFVTDIMTSLTNTVNTLF